jgi:hypothetical protein
MRIKPESVPEWDGNADTLARWLSKINQLAGKSENIHKELGKVIPHRSTGSAESWYYSISERDRRKLEKSWDTLKEGISAYWMNHDWLSKQKLRASRATFKEPGHSPKSPSEFVICKKNLVSLVYDYSDTGLIKFIMESVPGNWHAIVHTLSMKTFREFQNSVKYYENTLARMSRLNSNGFQQILDKFLNSYHMPESLPSILSFSCISPFTITIVCNYSFLCDSFSFKSSRSNCRQGGLCYGY